MAHQSSRKFRGPANTFPPLRCERLEDRSVLSIAPGGLLLLHGANTGDVEVMPSDSDPAASIVVEEGIAEAVAGGETIAPDGGIAIDAGDESWDDSWYTDDWSTDQGTWDDSWVSDEGNRDDTGYTDDYYDNTGYTDDANGDDSWVPDDEYWDNSWADDTGNDWLPDDGSDVVILPAPDDGTWFQDWINSERLPVPGSDNSFDSGGIFYAMAAAGGVPVEDSIAPLMPLAPETANLSGPATDAGSLPSVSPLVAPVTETSAATALAISLPPDASAKKLNALSDVTMPLSESDSVVPSPTLAANSESADDSSTQTFAAPTEPTNDHLADPASLALTDDLPVG